MLRPRLKIVFYSGAPRSETKSQISHEEAPNHYVEDHFDLGDGQPGLLGALAHSRVHGATRATGASGMSGKIVKGTTRLPEVPSLS